MESGGVSGQNTITTNRMSKTHVFILICSVAIGGLFFVQAIISVNAQDVLIEFKN